MKIAIFSDNFYPELSGITDSLIIFGDELAKRGHKVLFVAPKYTKENFDELGLGFVERLASENISYLRLHSIKNKNYPTKQGRIALPSLRGILAVRKFKPDIIYSNSPFGVGIQALIDSKLLAVPFVGTNHTPPSEFMRYSPINNNWSTKLTQKYFSWYYNKTVECSTPCQSLLDEMRKFGFKAKCRVIPNPTDLKLFSPVSSKDEKNTLKQKFGLSEKTILYTGRLALEKNIDIIIRAISIAKKSIPSIQFAITGTGSSFEYLKEITVELGLEENVKFLGFVDEKIFPDLYKASDIFAIMSRAESQSLSLMKAMATGIPVIGADARALPEYITPECGYVVPLGDYSRLAETFVKIFSDDELREKLGQGSLMQVLKYSTEKIVNEWEQIFFSLK